MGVLVLSPSDHSVMYQSSKSQKIPFSLEEISASACLSRPLPPIPEEFDNVAPDEDPFTTSSEKTKSSINHPQRVDANSFITSKRPTTKRVAEAATQVDEALGQESSPEPRHIMKQKVLATPPRNFRPNTRRNDVNYAMCDAVLSGSPTETCIPSPKGAHVNARWGQSSLNWTMCSVWEPNLMSHPFFNKLKDVSDEVNCSKYELQMLINDVFSSFCDDEFSEFADEDFVVLLVTEKSPEQAYLPCSERIEIEVKEVKFTPHLSESVATIAVSPAYILACGSLADILRAIVVQSDVLLLSGGYGVTATDNKPGVPTYTLNFKKETLTQLVRVPLSRKDDIFLMEKIEPCARGASFRFTYVAKRNLTRRNVVQHRDFIYKEFCRNVTDTLAYERNRWDFPMPIVHNAEPRDIYDLLVLPNFRMMSSCKNHSFDDSSSPNTSMSTSTVPCFSDDDLTWDTAKESFSDYQHDEIESRPQGKRVSFESSPEEKDMPVFRSGQRRPLKKRVTDDLDFDDESFNSSQYSQSSQQGSQSATRKYYDRSHNQPSSQRKYGADSTPKFDPPDQPSSFCMKRFHGKCYCICNLMFWIILLLLIFFMIATICVMWVSFKSDTCQVKPTGVSTYPVSDSNKYFNPFANTGEENSVPVIGRSNNESIFLDTPWFKDKWNVVKDWVTSCIKWIDENCGLECILAKMGIYLD